MIAKKMGLVMTSVRRWGETGNKNATVKYRGIVTIVAVFLFSLFAGRRIFLFLIHHFHQLQSQ